MNAPMLASREALANAMHAAQERDPDAGPNEFADALLASGVVRDPATIAHGLRALADALTDGGAA